MADKYLLGQPSRNSDAASRGGALFTRSSRSSSAGSSQLPVLGIHVLLAALAAIWALEAFTGLPLRATLALDAAGPGGAAGLLGGATSAGGRWSWRILTDALCAASGPQLARNLFMGYMFGRVVENTAGTRGLLLTYALSGAGGAAAAAAALPRRAPLAGAGATGALLGLFAMATLFNRRKTWHWDRVFELAVLAPFVVLQLLQGHAALAHWQTLAGPRVGAWIPLLGGLAGAALAALLLQLLHLVEAGLARQQQQRQRQQQGAQQGEGAAGGGGGGGGSGDSGAGRDEPLGVLLSKAASALLRQLL